MNKYDTNLISVGCQIPCIRKIPFRTLQTLHQPPTSNLLFRIQCPRSRAAEFIPYSIQQVNQLYCRFYLLSHCKPCNYWRLLHRSNGGLKIRCFWHLCTEWQTMIVFSLSLSHTHTQTQINPTKFAGTNILPGIDYHKPFMLTCFANPIQT
jgi:hypothetical protein